MMEWLRWQSKKTLSSPPPMEMPTFPQFTAKPLMRKTIRQEKRSYTTKGTKKKSQQEQWKEWRCYTVKITTLRQVTHRREDNDNCRGFSQVVSGLSPTSGSPVWGSRTVWFHLYVKSRKQNKWKTTTTKKNRNRVIDLENNLVVDRRDGDEGVKRNWGRWRRTNFQLESKWVTHMKCVGNTVN